MVKTIRRLVLELARCVEVEYEEAKRAFSNGFPEGSDGAIPSGFRPDHIKNSPEEQAYTRRFR